MAKPIKFGAPWNADCVAVRHEVEAARREAAAAGWPAVPDNTRVADFFAGRSVLATGATGFVGRLLIELLLRTCPDVRRVYVVMRPKRGVAIRDRLRVAVADPLFDRLRAEQPDALDKVHPLEGEISQPCLGLSEEDVALVCREVSVFYNVAANVHFTDPLKKALGTNLRSAEEAVALAKRMPNLKVLIHVSTAYTNTNQELIEERVYPMPVDWRTVLRASETIPDPDSLDFLGPKLMEWQPNSYTFSKALAEQVMKEAAAELPVVIVRPSMVIGTVSEPIPGWIDNLYGPAVFWVLVGKGIVRTMRLLPNISTNLIPGDLVANAILLASWAKGIGVSLSSDADKGEVDVVHSVTLPSMGTSFDEMLFFGNPLMRTKAPFPGGVRYPKITATPSWFKYALISLWEHFVFAVVLDLAARLAGQKPRLLGIYRKFVVGLATVRYFIDMQVNFRATNQWRLQGLLLPSDTKDFCRLNFLSSKDSFENYEEWSRTTLKGITLYCLKEEYNPPKNAAHVRKLWWIEKGVLAVLALLCIMLLWVFMPHSVSESPRVWLDMTQIDLPSTFNMSIASKFLTSIK